MKISFQNIDMNNDAQSANMLSKKNSYGNADMSKNIAASNVKNGIRLDMGNTGKGLFDESMNGKKGKSITELQMEAGAIDVGVDKNYRVVMSNTMSGEDYAKAQKDGFDYSSMDPDDIVTIQDKVKAELAMSGVIIVGYNDNMDSEVLSEAVGSDTLARGIKGNENISVNMNESYERNDVSDVMKEAYADSDLPMTKENAENLEKAWGLASSLKQPTEGSIAYMVENEMRPTIWNFYLAENSGAANNNRTREFIDNDVNKNDTIVRQIEKIVEEAGLNKDATTHADATADAQWLLNNSLPVTADNIRNLKNIKSVAFPVSEKNFSEAAAAAVAEGKEPVYADLTRTKSIYSMATELEQKYFSAQMREDTAGDITARRQLEEIRLSMTAEVNVKLISSGFSIDTQPMEQLIDALKAAEASVAARYFDKYTESDGEAVSSYRLMNAANKAVDEIRTAPAATLGMFTARNANVVTLGELHSESIVVRDTYIKAGESYEALMTAPRADLGDRITKAFTGIDSLLDSMGIDVSDSNRRAARILGYNSMDITVQNINRIVHADRIVQSVIEKMTPASVLQMIRDGVNPLTNDLASINNYLSSVEKDEYSKETKDYSEFLYGLDMQDALTVEERESFIGIYRMLHQIEKNDGAVIGSVINEKAELDFNNLISASRSNRLKGIDVRIDSDFGSTDEIYEAANSITTQISAAFIGQRYDAEIAELRKSADTGADVTGMLEQFDIPASAENMSAMERLISVDDNMFAEIQKYAVKSNKNDKNVNKHNSININTDLSADSNKISNNSKIGDNGKIQGMTDLVNDLEKAIGTENFEDKVENFTKELDAFAKELTFSVDDYIDVKALSMIHMQLGMIAKVNEHTEESAEADYIVPYDTGAGIAKAHIAFRQGEDGSAAKLDIKAQISEGVAELHMSLSGDKLEGYFVGNTAPELKKMESVSDILIESLKENDILSGLAIDQIPVFTREGEGTDNLLTENNYRSKDANGLHSEGTERSVLLQVAKIFLQSVRRA